LPEATLVHEAARLQDDLRRAQIEPFVKSLHRGLTMWSFYNGGQVNQRCGYLGTEKSHEKIALEMKSPLNELQGR
jgi:hypothetical protein